MISSILEEQCQSICELIQMHLQAPACSSEIPAKISNMMTNSNLIRAPTSWQHMARWKQLAVHKKLCFFRPQVRDESEASPPTLPTSQRPPLCDLLSRIYLLTFKLLQPGLCTQSAWGCAVSHGTGRAWCKLDLRSVMQCPVPLIRQSRFNVRAVPHFTSTFNMHWSRISNV